MILQHLQELKAKKIVLGSSSPRRKEILELIGLKFDIKVSNFAENLDKSTFKTADEYVLKTCFHKAIDIYNRLEEEEKQSIDLIICADTIVVVIDESDNNSWKILEKPSSHDNAIEILSLLSKSVTHLVITSVTLLLPKIRNNHNDKLNNDANNNNEIDCYYRSFSEITKVEFSPLSDEEIRAYVNTNEPMDKAGGYGIQGLGSTFVKGISGCYYNVMGLPLHHLCDEINHLIKENKL